MRGTAVAWRSLLTNLLRPLSADLALLVPACGPRTILHDHARYDWSFDEPVDDWGCELNRICRACGVEEDSWRASAKRTAYEGMWGGVVLDHRSGPAIGSGAIIMVLRDLLLDHMDVIREYDKVVITRSDHLYIAPHPPLSPLDQIQVPKGEDWWGITDRHHVIDKESIETYLCIARWWMQNHELVGRTITAHHNPEQLFFLFLQHTDLYRKVVRDDRCM
eukprot:6212506-Pleurochrysis_carterae.AAC.1